MQPGWENFVEVFLAFSEHMCMFLMKLTNLRIFTKLRKRTKLKNGSSSTWVLLTWSLHFERIFKIHENVHSSKWTMFECYTLLLQPFDLKFFYLILLSEFVIILSSVCPKDEFHCLENRCISKERVCDGTKDCRRGEDEHSCIAEGTASFKAYWYPNISSIFLFLGFL